MVSQFIKGPFQQQVVQDIVQQTEQAEKAKQDSPTDEAFERIQNMMKAQEQTEPKFIDVRLKPDEKARIHKEVVSKLASGFSPAEIASSVVNSVEEVLHEKHRENKRNKAVDGPVFRRVDE